MCAILTSVNSASPATLFGGTWEALNSGNALKLPIGNIPVTTSDANISASLTTYDKNLKLGYINGGQWAFESYTLPLLHESGGGLANEQNFSHTAYHKLQPSNLWAEMSDAISVYMWRRTA